jgi:hypothetical protein
LQPQQVTLLLLVLQLLLNQLVLQHLLLGLELLLQAPLMLLVLLLLQQAALELLRALELLLQAALQLLLVHGHQQLLHAAARHAQQVGAAAPDLGGAPWQALLLLLLPETIQAADPTAAASKMLPKGCALEAA